MPLIEKEIIAPGTYFYTDEKTGSPRKLVVTPELTKYWQEQGKAMLNSGLTVPVPYEHDFNAHPMTPKEKLLNNAGWVQDYIVKDAPDPDTGVMRKDVLFGMTDIKDEKVAEKLPNTIRWTSPWINSFVDGNGKQWNNVISHLALTLRPRITKQLPFGSIAASLSIDSGKLDNIGSDGFFLSRAGRVIQRKSDKKLFPMYPMAFSLFNGIALDVEPKKKPPTAKKPESEGGKPDSNPTPDESIEGKGEGEYEEPDGSPIAKEGGKPGEKPGQGDDVDLPPLGSKAGDVSMEEVLCDLLRALGVDCEHSGDEQQFKRNLYMAAMQKVHELTNKGMNKDDEVKAGEINKGNPPGSQPNPIIQQEQQPMYMGLDMSATLSLEDIKKIEDPTMRTIALSMFNENAKLRSEMEASAKTANSLRDAKLKEANDKRIQRVTWLTKFSPKAKDKLEEMLKAPSMALSLGDNGNVIDPMDQTLSMMELTIGSLPQLLVTDSAALSVQQQPTDEQTLSEEQSNELSDSLSRMMGGQVPPKKSA